MNTLYIDEVFLRQISGRLSRFKQTAPHHFNSRCPICGDSQKSRSKARWHAFPHNTKGFLVCKCHNCGYSNSFDNFLREIEPEVHKMYIMEKYRGANNKVQPTTLDFSDSKPAFDTSPLKKLKKVSQLDIKHPVRQWVIDKRKIPHKNHYRLYYCPAFKKWTNKVLPGKFESEENDEPRLLIPLFDENDRMFGFQGRSFSKKSIRYITIMLEDDKGKLFGLDTVDPNETVYCVEGPLDSLFINNAIASCGGDIVTDLPLTNIPKENIVVVYDNEPRNVDTIAKIEKAIAEGYKVCIWPDHIVQKDINDMVLANYLPLHVINMIKDNTFSGLAATMRLMKWRKV